MSGKNASVATCIKKKKRKKIQGKSKNVNRYFYILKKCERGDTAQGERGGEKEKENHIVCYFLDFISYNLHAEL